MTEKKIKITQAKGRPMLQWVGKKPLEFVKSFPAQLVETFNQDKNSKPDNEFSKAKFETFLSKAEAPAISIF